MPAAKVELAEWAWGGLQTEDEGAPQAAASGTRTMTLYDSPYRALATSLHSSGR